MEPSPVGPSCPLLEKLPVELRLEVYSYLLTFAAPLKLRQVIPGSRDLAILRTNRQIHDEALSVLYELNAIVVTRNGRSTLALKFATPLISQIATPDQHILTPTTPDFCLNTDPTLKTPLRSDQARTLLISSFSQSIACTLRGPLNRCPVCQPSAAGLWEVLRVMPKLKAVTIDFSRHVREMLGLVEAAPGLIAALPEWVDDGGVGGEVGGEGRGKGKGRRSWRVLRGEAVEGVSVRGFMWVEEEIWWGGV